MNVYLWFVYKGKGLHDEERTVRLSNLPEPELKTRTLENLNKRVWFVRLIDVIQWLVTWIHEGNHLVCKHSRNMVARICKCFRSMQNDNEQHLLLLYISLIAMDNDVDWLYLNMNQLRTPYLEIRTLLCFTLSAKCWDNNYYIQQSILCILKYKLLPTCW